MTPRRNPVRSKSSKSYYEIEYGECPSQLSSQIEGHYFFTSGSNTPITNPTYPRRSASVKPIYISDIVLDCVEWKSTNHHKPFNVTGAWPPTSLENILNTEVDDAPFSTDRARTRFYNKHGEPRNTVEDCLGKYCWQKKRFGDEDRGFFCANAIDERIACNHTYTEWILGGTDWQSRLELRDVPQMGVGVFSKHSWKEDEVLGAYVGVLTPFKNELSNYVHEIDIGAAFEGIESSKAYIDAERKGNWTRFCNHSCDNNAEIRTAKVGSRRVLAVMAIKSIRPGDQVLIDYGSDYFIARPCLCNSAKCKYPVM